MGKVQVTRLPKLHIAQTEAYFNALRGEPLCDANGTPILDAQGQIQWRPPSAAVLRACNEFLKNNGIDREPVDGDAISQLAGQIRKYDDDPILEIEGPDSEENQ